MTLIDNILLETYPTSLFSKVLPVYKVPGNSITISTNPSGVTQLNTEAVKRGREATRKGF